jgi:hypothetical protein
VLHDASSSKQFDVSVGTYRGIGPTLLHIVSTQQVPNSPLQGTVATRAVGAGAHQEELAQVGEACVNGVVDPVACPCIRCQARLPGCGGVAMCNGQGGAAILEKLARLSHGGGGFHHFAHTLATISAQVHSISARHQRQEHGQLKHVCVLI